MRISIVTLNYNGSKETLELLKSLQEQTDTDFEIIIVDNASEEADFANLQTSLTMLNIVNPQVEVLRNSENLGFSGGNNVGIRPALTPNQRLSNDADRQSVIRCEGRPLKNGSEWVVLLNNDTWVEKSFIERLKAVLSVKKGLVTIPLIEGDRVAYCGGVRWLKPHGHHIYNEYASKIEPNIYAIGGAVAIHKSVFDKIGFLDEKYFLYFEDADFSIRAKKAGFDISIAENISVHHHVSSSSKKLGTSLLMRYHYRNALYFNLKNGPWYIKLAVWPWSWIIVIKQLSKVAMKHNVEQSKAILAGVIDFYRNRFSKINTKY